MDNITINPYTEEELSYDIGSMMFKILDELCIADLFSYAGKGKIEMLSDTNVSILIDPDGQAYGESGVFVTLWDDIYKCDTFAEAVIHLIETLFSEEYE